MRTFEVGRFIAEYLDLDLEPVTKELREKKVRTSETGEVIELGDWMGPLGLPANDNGKLATLDDYHGDFKHRKREEEMSCNCGTH